jgi:hypothetical protein
LFEVAGHAGSGRGFDVGEPVGRTNRFAVASTDEA